MKTLAPEEVEFSSERLGRVNKLVQRYIDGGKLAGIVTMLNRRGQTFHFEKFGMADLEAGVPMELDTIFRIYSMTKPITSVAVMMLYEEGRFLLDDPVSHFIPQLSELKVCEGIGESGPILVDQERPITIRHLLTHTAGLGHSDFQDSPVGVMYREVDLRNPDHSLKDFVEILGQLPLVYQPGTAWKYSVATDVLGYLVEVVSGQSFDQFLRERIFEPLGMSDTDFYVPEDKLDRLASVYGPSAGGGIEVLDNPNVNAHKHRCAFISGNGGLVSTALDYMRFCQMLLNGGESSGVRLLGPKTIELMTTNHLPQELIPYTVNQSSAASTKGCGFGLGFKVIMDIAEHGLLGSIGNYSWSGAACTEFLIDPKEELIALFLAQFMPSGYYPVRREFQVAVYQAMVD